MLQKQSVPIRHDISKILVKLAVAVLALLVIRVIADHLPMLQNASPIIVGGNSAQAGNISQSAAQAYSNWISSFPANAPYADMQKAAQQVMTEYAGVGIIFPVSIANAIVDTLIFAMLILSGLEFKRFMETHSTKLPEAGTMALLLLATIVVALAYSSYGGIFPPLLGTDSGIYGWVFLALGLIPLIGLILVGWRNMNAITELVFASAGSAVSSSLRRQSIVSLSVCSKCGASLEPEVKFCNACGAPVKVGEKPKGKFCGACGAKNNATAKFCESCGKRL